MGRRRSPLRRFRKERCRFASTVGIGTKTSRPCCSQGQDHRPTISDVFRGREVNRWRDSLTRSTLTAHSTAMGRAPAATVCDPLGSPLPAGGLHGHATPQWEECHSRRRA
jgi:hypothetical protein